jgi:hypothetical protein
MKDSLTDRAPTPASGLQKKRVLGEGFRRMNDSHSTSELKATERAFVATMQWLCFGRFEFLRIERGELVLDPWPTTVRQVKFCAKTGRPDTIAEEFLVKQRVVEFFDYIRSIEFGEIRVLEVKNGLPFSMEVELHWNSDTLR